MKLLVMLFLLLVSEYFRIEKEKKERSERRMKLAQTKIELELQRKREEFEAFKAYFEEKHKEELYEGYTTSGERVEGTLDELINNDDVEDGSIDVIDFVEGVQKLRDNGHKYVPYERPNPLNDIRNSLSEFTVNDVLNTFYF